MTIYYNTYNTVLGYKYKCWKGFLPVYPNTLQKPMKQKLYKDVAIQCKRN